MRTLTAHTAAAAAAATAASAANASITITTDEAAFATSVNVVDDFNDYINSGDPDISLLPGPTTLGQLTYTPVGGSPDPDDLELRAGFPGSVDAGLFAFLNFTAGFGFTVSSASGQPLNAFGANLISAASLGGTTIITLDNGDSFNVGDVLGSPGTGFVGFTSDTPFTSVQFTVTDTSTFEGLFIDTIYADIVPTPASASLLTLAGLAATRRRR